MKIVYVKDLMLPTAGYQVNFLSKWHVKHGHDVTIITTDGLKYWRNSGFINDEYVDKINYYDREMEKSTGVKVQRMHSYGSISSREIFGPSVFRRVQKLNPDVVFVHLNDSLTAMRFFRRAKKLRYPIISDSHMVNIASKNKFAKYFRIVYTKFITPKIVQLSIPVIAVTEETREYNHENYSIPYDLLPVIQLGTDTDLFFPDENKKREFREKNNLLSTDRVFIYTGKIIPSKKVMLLAQVFGKKFPGDKRAVLIIVGSGSGEYYEKTLKLFEHSENIVLFFPTQELTQLPGLYQAADISVIPGACSLSIYDQQASGLTCIGEDIDVMKERVGEDESCGYLYSKDNVDDFRKCMTRAFDDSDKTISEMGRRAREKVCLYNSYDILASEVELIMKRRIEEKLNTNEEKKNVGI